MKTILLDGKKSKRKGVYGKYFQISKNKGIKVLASKFRTIENAKLHYLYHQAHQEALNLKLARERYYYVPKCYGVCIVKFKSTFGIGIIMEHLGTKLLCDVNHVKDDRILSKLNRNLKSVNIIHKDLHNENVMLYNCNWYVIDFGLVEFI